LANFHLECETERENCILQVLALDFHQLGQGLQGKRNDCYSGQKQVSISGILSKTGAYCFLGRFSIFLQDQAYFWQIDVSVVFEK